MSGILLEGSNTYTQVQVSKMSAAAAGVTLSASERVKESKRRTEARKQMVCAMVNAHVPEILHLDGESTTQWPGCHKSTRFFIFKNTHAFKKRYAGL